MKNISLAKRAALLLSALAVGACGSVKAGSGGAAGMGGAGGTSAMGGAGGTGGAATTGFTTFQAADVVIGQADFTSNAAPAAPGAATTDYTPGAATFDGTRLFVPDTYAQRVLGFATLPTSNGAAATVVLGQAAPTTKTPGTALATYYLPQSVHTDGTTLALADTGNHRVLLLPTTATTGAAAGVVVGWPDATTPSSGCAPDRLRSPASAFLGGGKLLVADRENNRVLVWNTVPTASGAAADLVLGQGSLTSTTCASNDSLRNGTTAIRSSGTLAGPTDVWTDGTRVLVADRGNNRVLVWLKFPMASGAPADLVIGQSSFTNARDGATSSTLVSPAALAYAGGPLFIADAGHNRVLGWNALPTANGTAADLVLGQGDFTHVSANDDAQAGVVGAAPTARTLALPSGVALAGDALVVSDTLNRRALVFRGH
jgi:hypothetical protein